MNKLYEVGIIEYFDDLFISIALGLIQLVFVKFI